MEADFWHERWQNNLTGFHLAEVNPYLKAHWPALQLQPAARVFVPLSGKTLDLLWLAEQGHEVVGIELSPLAVEAFFAENQLPVERSQLGQLELWKSGRISLFCGDFFDLTAEILGHIDAVYDRASLVALPPAMRKKYAAKMTELVPLAPKLLVSLDYDQSKMDGPPFSVSEGEIQDLYQAHYQITLLSAEDVLGNNEKFRKRGLNAMNECIYQLKNLG